MTQNCNIFRIVRYLGSPGYRSNDHLVSNYFGNAREFDENVIFSIRLLLVDEVYERVILVSEEVSGGKSYWIYSVFVVASYADEKFIRVVKSEGGRSLVPHRYNEISHHSPSKYLYTRRSGITDLRWLFTCKE